MGNSQEINKASVIFADTTYDSVFRVPGIEIYDSKKSGVRRKRYTPPHPGKQLPEKILKTFPDGKVFLLYRSVSFIPTSEGHFIANKASTIAIEQAGEFRHYTVFDIGTGSGLIATYVAEALQNNSNSTVVASDISGDALTVAALNFQLNGIVNEPKLRKKDMLDNLSQEFGKPHLIVSNPPLNTHGKFAGNGFDPEIALDGGNNGLDFYKKLFDESRGVLTDDGLMLLQIQEMNLKGVLNYANRFLPGAATGFLDGPCRKVCGILVGRHDRAHTSDITMLN